MAQKLVIEFIYEYPGDNEPVQVDLYPEKGEFTRAQADAIEKEFNSNKLVDSIIKSPGMITVESNKPQAKGFKKSVTDWSNKQSEFKKVKIIDNKRKAKK